ncbi:MAG: aminodeoxychorismate/anthranilate synthase component II [Deltaproteobacteria bacterium]|nr:aminodeoxychorismate/anthranilate synthase component II [Deltaproteobacteria bacterium]MBU49092.1 aminodeoxychorismate/anthranilate synthase component II [Deltaproteobacteria bacterium]
MKRILVLDNYDSFTYNLVHYLQDIGGAQLDVIRNDKLTIDEVEQYDKILLSPGPGIPEEAGIMPALIKRYAPTKSILGVCLGHQGIAEAFGGTLLNMKDVVHGKGTPINVLDKDEELFANIPETFIGGRYHSWLVQREGLPACLKITAEDEEHNIMALSHTQYDVKGIQFHPESVLTPEGKQMLRNWMH